MTEEPATYEIRHKKTGRPKKEMKGERMWIPAECVEFVKRYIELSKQQNKKKTE